MSPMLKTFLSLLLSAQLCLAAAAPASPPASEAPTHPAAAAHAPESGASGPSLPAPPPAPTPDPADEAFRQEVLTSLDDLDESLDLIMARPAGQTEPSLAEDAIERSGLNPKGAIEKARAAVAALDTTSLEFQEMKKGLGRNDSWKTASEKLTGRRNGDGTRTGGIFSPEVLEGLKTRKPKKGKGNNDDLLGSRAGARVGEVASLSKLYFAEVPAGASGSRRAGPAAHGFGGRTRHRREFASVRYFDHGTANCPAGSPMGYTDIIIARTVELGLDAVMEGLPTDGLTIVGRLAVVAARAAASGAVLVIESLNDINGDCIEDAFKNSVDGKLADIAGLAAFTRLRIDNETHFTDDTELEAAKSGLQSHVTTAKDAVVANDNSNRALVIDNANANKGAIIANDNANKDEARNFLLRLQIEADLASDGATPVGLFASPATPNCNAASAAPVNQCGLLDMSRQIVVQTIARIAGTSAAQANAFLTKGDSYKNARNYKAAYQQYKMAYKAAVK